jgi:hypothetical protein
MPKSHSANTKQDRVRRLVVLPFRTSLAIAFKSIQARFMRSLITTLSLVLAVAFLGYVNVGNNLLDGLLATGDPELRAVLDRAGYDLAPGQNQVSGSPKQRWIVALSLLVCVAGIVNAQLMAVTERFREIGTMKCLGALDRFVLRLFLLEAGMQGLVGAAAGAVVGAVAALLAGLLRFGTVSIAAAPWNAIGESVLFAVVVGCVLSLLGVLYPAILAARMQPVEAMRTEH